MLSDRTHAIAADWFARLLSPDCTERERERFEQWCAASERHADAFAAVAQCHADAAALKDDELIRAAARAARRASVHVAASWPVRFARLATAAALVLAIAGGVFWIVRGDTMQSVRYVTVVGEQRSVNLVDGTRVQLDTDTDFTVRYDDTTRELALDRGRIQVTVAADAKRAFLVRSGRGIVRDVGTEFQVANYAGEVTVTLLSGIVSVALAKPPADGDDSRVLAPGQQLRYGAHGGLGPATPVDLGVASGWTSGTLIFRDRRLGDLLEEMNRYSQTKIRADDPALARLVVSGVFRAGDQASLLQALQTGWSIRSQRVSADEIMLSPAH